MRPGTLDATGALVPESTARFTTGDGTPPPLHANPTVCRSDEVPVGDACVRADDESLSLRLTLSGAARFAWSLGSRVGSSVAPRGEIAIGLDGLLPATPFTIAAGAADYAGQETVFTFTTATTEPLPTLSITEVRADPAGAEPRQEYVEIENYGPRPIVLAGLRLSDSDGEGDALPAAEIAAGGRFLVVTDDFDPEDGSGGDATVPRGTVLVRVDHTLCAGGLSNSGEPVYLRDASHRRISAAPATPPPLQGVCIVRTAASMRSGDAGTFEYDPSRTCTPGR